MNLRRSKIDIVHDILRAMHDKGGKIKPTHLLYKSNLSHKRMKEYIDELLEKKLILEEKDEEKTIYSITDQGRDFLMNYKKLKEFTDAFGL